MTGIERYTCTSPWRKVHPAEKICFALITLLLCLVSRGYGVPLGTVVIMGFCLVCMAGIPLRFYLRIMLVPGGFLLAGAAAVACTVSLQQTGFLFSIPVGGRYIGISAAGAGQAGLLSARSLGAVSCIYLVILTTPFEVLAAELERWRVPKILVELMLLMYRFLFVVWDNAVCMHVAQAARLGHRNLRTGFRSLGILLSRLFVRSLHRSERLSWALLARGYTGTLSFLPGVFQHSKKYIIFFTVCDVLLAVMLVIQGS